MKNDAKIKWDYRNEIHKKIDSGTIILSEPFMLDPSFARSACLIINHDKHEGTFGLILNKTSGTKVSNVVKEIKKDWPIYYGGPVDQKYLFYIHTDSQLTDAIKIKDNLFWNGDFKELTNKINKGELNEQNVRFFLGYSGWDGGQLRREIIENSWIISNNIEKYIFEDPRNIWKNILTEMDGNYKKFANFPVDPNLN